MAAACLLHLLCAYRCFGEEQNRPGAAILSVGPAFERRKAVAVSESARPRHGFQLLSGYLLSRMLWRRWRRQESRPAVCVAASKLSILEHGNLMDGGEGLRVPQEKRPRHCLQLSAMLWTQCLHLSRPWRNLICLDSKVQTTRSVPLPCGHEAVRLLHGHLSKLWHIVLSLAAGSRCGAGPKIQPQLPEAEITHGAQLVRGRCLAADSHCSEFDCSDGWNCFRIGTVAGFPWLQSLTEDSPQLRVENEFGQA